MRNKGVTLIEVIVVVVLIFLVIPLFWNYINSSVEDNATINNKIAVQSTVNALMNRLQQDIQEARCPINPNTTEDEYMDIEDDGFLICKPENASVLYKLNKDTGVVTVYYDLSLLGKIENGKVKNLELGNSETYNDINSITLTKIGEKGLKVNIRGEIDSKSGYSLENTYYTRNTTF